MAEEKKKSIPIEDGKKAEEKTEAEVAADAKTGAEADAGVEPETENAESEAKSAEEEGMAQASEGENAEKSGTAECGAAEGSGTAGATEKAESESGGPAESAEDTPSEELSAEEQESERYMRLMAEFQNFKRRAAKEKSDIHAFANERIVSDLLPVLDNFERALEGASESRSEAGGDKDGTAGADGVSGSDYRGLGNEELANYAKGMELIFEQLKAALEKAGLKEIEALGCDFDPNVHNAVMTDQTDEYEDGKVSKVMQKGYTLNDKVVRPSMVAVNKK